MPQGYARNQRLDQHDQQGGWKTGSPKPEALTSLSGMWSFVALSPPPPQKKKNNKLKP